MTTWASRASRGLPQHVGDPVLRHHEGEDVPGQAGGRRSREGLLPATA